MRQSFTLLNGLTHHKDLEHSSRRELIDIIKALDSDIESKETIEYLEDENTDLRDNLSESKEECGRYKNAVLSVFKALDIEPEGV